MGTWQQIEDYLRGIALLCCGNRKLPCILHQPCPQLLPADRVCLQKCALEVMLNRDLHS